MPLKTFGNEDSTFFKMFQRTDLSKFGTLGMSLKEI